jgi:hypothetical protein
LSRDPSEGLDQLVLRDAGRLAYVSQRVLGDDAVLVLAEEQADGRLVFRSLGLRTDASEFCAELEKPLGSR